MAPPPDAIIGQIIEQICWILSHGWNWVMRDALGNVSRREIEDCFLLNPSHNQKLYICFFPASQRVSLRLSGRVLESEDGDGVASQRLHESMLSHHKQLLHSIDKYVKEVLLQIVNHGTCVGSDSCSTTTPNSVIKFIEEGCTFILVWHFAFYDSHVSEYSLINREPCAPSHEHMGTITCECDSTLDVGVKHYKHTLKETSKFSWIIDETSDDCGDENISIQCELGPSFALALCMASHTRLGNKSLLGIFSSDLIFHLFELSKSFVIDASYGPSLIKIYKDKNRAELVQT